VGAFAIVVAGNSLPGAKVTDVDGKQIVLPDWDAEEWAWWLRMCVDMSRAMENEAPAGTKPDPELEAARTAATAMLTSDGSLRQEFLAGDEDEIGWLAIGARVLMLGGRLVLRQSKRIAKWVAPSAKKAKEAAWGPVSSLFKKAPKRTAAAVFTLAAPEQAEKVVKSAGNMVAGLFGSGAAALTKGLAPLLLPVAIAVGLYYAFRGKGAADD
jgi:hypothetical protein